MAQKTIPDLTLIGGLTEDVSVPGDNGSTTYRFTIAQLLAFFKLQFAKTVTISSAGTTLDTTNRIVLLNPTSASFIQALPACASLPTDFLLTFKNIATNGNTATLDANASELIDNATTLVLGSDPSMDSVTLINTGSKWLVI